MKQLLALSALVLVAGCGSETPEQAIQTNPIVTANEVDTAPLDTVAPSPTVPVAVAKTVALSDNDKGRVCRAAIASLNGRDPGIIRVISNKAGVHRVRYTRDDGTVWTNECRVGDGTAEWRMVENGQPGRWRTEDTIRFAVDGPSISINTFMGADLMTSDTYTLE